MIGGSKQDEVKMDLDWMKFYVSFLLFDVECEMRIINKQPLDFSLKDYESKRKEQP